MKFSRRQLLLGGSASAALASLGGVYVFTGEMVPFIAGFVRHALPGARFADGAAESFAGDFLDVSGADKGKIKQLMHAGRLVGYDGLDYLFGGNVSYELFKRRVATRFMISSTFFESYDREDPIRYLGISGACANPFARFA